MASRLRNAFYIISVEKSAILGSCFVTLININSMFQAVSWSDRQAIQVRYSLILYLYNRVVCCTEKLVLQMQGKC